MFLIYGILQREVVYNSVSCYDTIISGVYSFYLEDVKKMKEEELNENLQDGLGLTKDPGMLFVEQNFKKRADEKNEEAFLGAKSKH